MFSHCLDVQNEAAEAGQPTKATSKVVAWSKRTLPASQATMQEHQWCCMAVLGIMQSVHGARDMHRTVKPKFALQIKPSHLGVSFWRKLGTSST